jgi:hypothetical protein
MVICKTNKVFRLCSFFTGTDTLFGTVSEKGVKQTWLAEQLGKSYNMVNGYVQNRQQPRLEVP